MTLDERLLEKAKAAGAALAEAERGALLARGDYHTAVRRLHLAGASLREIAQALSMSHQRVQQIVSAAGGSWWMAWRNRNRPRDAVCTWCERPPAEVSRLIAGPSVYICDDCVSSAEAAVRAGGAPAFARIAARGAATRCAFCRKRPGDGRRVAVGRANVCTDCLRVCREILDGRA